MIIHAVVSGKSDAVERGLCAFGDAHFEVDAVAFHIDFDGLDAAEHVAIVIVLIAHGIFVGLQTLHHEGLVVEVAFLHFEGSGQSFGGIDGVAHPVDVAHIILLALADVEIDIDVLGIDGHHGVSHHQGVTIAPRVEFVDDEAFVFFILFRQELARTERNPLFER